MAMLYYEDEYVQLHHGDCEDILPALNGIDLVVTSPPYNLRVMPWKPLGHWTDGQAKGGGGKWDGSDGRGGVEYDSHEDAMPWVEYEAWQKRVLRMLWETLTERGAIFYNHKPRIVGTEVWLPTSLNPGLPLRQILIWARSGGINYLPSAYVSTHEWIMIFAKEAWRLKSKSASGVGDVWRIHQQPNPDHPAPFPVSLPAQAIETTAPRLVLDPFAGSGTTLRAARDAGVRAIGIEKSEAYCELIVKRLSQQAFDFSALEAEA